MSEKKKWTKEQENFLIGNIGKLSLKKISEKINKTIASVSNKVARMGLGRKSIYILNPSLRVTIKQYRNRRDLMRKLDI